MDWWKRLFDADRMTPTMLGFVGAITWLFLAFQGTDENAVSIGSVSVNPLQLEFGCTCLVLLGVLLIRYLCTYRDGNAYKYLP